MRSFIALAVRRRVAVLMTALAVVAFGIVGYQRLALDLLPDISYPSLTVQTDFPDTAPAEVENLVTRPVEETVGVLKGLKTIHSVSRSGVSEVTLEFEWGSDMDMLSMDVRDKLDRLVLPAEADDPIVLRFDPSLDPVMRLALSGPSDLTELRQMADKRLKQEFETIKGVAAAQVKGGLEEEIQIDVQQERLAAMGIPLSRVGEVVGVSNINLPGGSLEDQQSQYLIRTVNEYDSVEEIGDLILRQDERGVVRLKDVATVVRGAKDREEITRVNGVESVEIAIFKEGDANTVNTARAVRERIADLGSILPPITTSPCSSTSPASSSGRSSEVRNAALFGGLLAILVLFAFLRDLRSTLIIAISIPLSLVATFLAMYRLNVSLNIMSLGGLTLGVGMLVDNSIVVLESIFRKRQEGLPVVPAAIDGTHEVGGGGHRVHPDHRGRVPAHRVRGGDRRTALQGHGADRDLEPAGLAGGGHHHDSDAGARSAVPEDAQSLSMPNAEKSLQTLGAFSRGYEKVVRAALRRKWTTIAIAFGCSCCPVGAVRFLGTELIPQLSEGEFFFEVNMPEGTPLAATDRMMQTHGEGGGGGAGRGTVFTHRGQPPGRRRRCRSTPRPRTSARSTW